MFPPAFPKAEATLMFEKPATILLELARLDARLLAILDMFTILVPSIRLLRPPIPFYILFRLLSYLKKKTFRLFNVMCHLSEGRGYTKTGLRPINKIPCIQSGRAKVLNKIFFASQLNYWGLLKVKYH
jgi:hypothetical protein